MRRFALLLTVAIAILPSASRAQDNANPALARAWKKIANLPPGTPILVRQAGPGLPQPCQLAWIDNTALACDGWSPDGAPQRLIFPAASVASVAKAPAFAEEKDSHAGVLIGMGVGGVLGILAGQRAGAGAAAVGGLIGTLAGGCTVIAFQETRNSYGPPIPPRPMFSVRRRF